MNILILFHILVDIIHNRRKRYKDIPIFDDIIPRKGFKIDRHFMYILMFIMMYLLDDIRLVVIMPFFFVLLISMMFIVVLLIELMVFLFFFVDIMQGFKILTVSLVDELKSPRGLKVLLFGKWRVDLLRRLIF